MRPLPSLFAGLNDIDAATAARRFQQRELKPGTVLFTEGEPADSLALITSGRLGIGHGDVGLAEVGPDQIVGEMALFEAGDRTATARAVEPTKVLVLSRAHYEELRDVMHPIAGTLERRAIAAQVERLRAVNERLKRIAPGEPRRPGAGFFDTIATLFGRGGPFSRETVDPVRCLQRNPLFRETSDEVLTLMAPVFAPTVFARGHLLCIEGEPGDQMFLLDEGEVDVVVANGDAVVNLRTLKPGSAFGMMSLVAGEPRNATCVARTRGVALTVDRTGWTALLEDGNAPGAAFRRAMIRLLADQIGEANAELSTHDVGRRTLGPPR